MLSFYAVILNDSIIGNLYFDAPSRLFAVQKP